MVSRRARGILSAGDFKVARHNVRRDRDPTRKLVASIEGWHTSVICQYARRLIQCVATATRGRAIIPLMHNIRGSAELSREIGRVQAGICEMRDAFECDGVCGTSRLRLTYARARARCDHVNYHGERRTSASHSLSVLSSDKLSSGCATFDTGEEKDGSGYGKLHRGVTDTVCGVPGIAAVAVAAAVEFNLIVMFMLSLY